MQKDTKSQDFPYMTGAEAAKKIGISPQGFHQRKDRPTPAKILGSGKLKTMLFKVEDIDAYIASKLKTSND